MAIRSDVPAIVTSDRLLTWVVSLTDRNGCATYLCRMTALPLFGITFALREQHYIIGTAIQLHSMKERH